MTTDVQVWVIDTNVLFLACGEEQAPGGQRDVGMRALMLLSKLAEKHSIAEDRCGRVSREYWRCWRRVLGDRGRFPWGPAANSLWKHLWNRSRISVEKPLPAAFYPILECAGMTREGDIAFVETANGTGHKLLASEDGDFTEGIKKMLFDSAGVGVRVMRISEALGAVG